MSGPLTFYGAFATEREAIAEARRRFHEDGHARTVWRLPAGAIDGVEAPERFVIRRGIGPEAAPSDRAVLVHGLSRRNPA